MGLNDILSDSTVKDKVIADCIQLMDEQVTAKKGIGGMALKTAYRVIKGLGPNYLSSAVNTLLPTVCDAIDPIWDDAVKSDDAVEYLSQNRSEVADQLLGVTDARIAKSSNKAVKGAYNQLRKSIKGDVEDAVPGLAKIIATYA
ncbi:MAG: hypothetical protein VKJ64_02990 [Leptolyngbyaceae bacterium]|nr:hypothetical protein [Leptolyngbyaceae bacterium]